ncbi:MAG: PAS domain S-box protein [Acidobacteria bacterium]|nr:PAS domain S-box protein [Acidobacteriota bacterium]
MLNDPSASFEPVEFDPIVHKQALAFLATTTDGVFVVDADWRVVYLSPNGEITLQKTRAEIFGKNLWEEFPASVQTRFFVEYQRAMKDRISVTVEDYSVARERWYEGNASPFQNGLLIYFRDVTERKRTVEALRESEERYRDLVENCGLLVGTHDAEGKVLSINQSFIRYFGLEHSDQVVGKSIREFLVPSVQHLFQHYLDKILTEGQAHGIMRVTLPGGQEHILEYDNNLRRDGPTPIVRCIGRDITEKKRLEAQSLRAQRMESIGSLASGIAHDLNNLLAPMIMVEHILRLKLTDAHSQSLLETLHTSIQRASGLVKQVVSFARSGESEQTTICPKHLLQDVAKLLTETFPRSITIHRNEAPELGAIHGDSTQIFQVLMNLCVNARDAMPEGGTLRLSAKTMEVAATHPALDPKAKAGRYVCFTVADTGEGIPTKIRDRIFDPFFTTKTPGRSAGLGLATALRIVTTHKGFIEVNSEEGQGAQFNVYFPAAQDEPIQETEAEGQMLPVGHGEVVLVVEDESAIREVTRETLETYGYQVITAADGAEAIALYAQHLSSVKVVLLDLAVAALDSSAITRALHKLKQDCIIIGISDLLFGNEVTELSARGITQVLTKPFTAEKLLKTLATVLEH